MPRFKADNPWTWAAVAAITVVAGFAYGTLSLAVESVTFDLRRLGESVYQAYERDGAWPVNIDDLEGTTFLDMPHRRQLLEEGVFVVVWDQSLAPNPAANADYILAYHAGGLLSWFGNWVCRGDLRVTYEASAR